MILGDGTPILHWLHRKCFNWFETTSCRWMSHETTDPQLTINLSPILNFSPKKARPISSQTRDQTWDTFDLQHGVPGPNPTTEPFGGWRRTSSLVARQTKNIQILPWVFGSFRSTIDPINPSSTKSVAFLKRLPYLGAQEKLPQKHIDKPKLLILKHHRLGQISLFPFGQAPQRGRSVAAMSNTALEVRLFRRCRWLALKLAGVAW